jgi:hypothetical protein
MEIFKETDLSKFKFYSGNRPIDKTNYSKIRDSISQKNMLKECPIIVNKNLEVLDGQHRLEAARDLGIPIYYLIKDGGNYLDVIALNENKKSWAKEDYLRIFSEGVNNENYVKVIDFMNRHNFNLSQALLLINGPIRDYEENTNFRKGNFIFPDDIDYIEESTRKVKMVLELIAEHGIKPRLRFRNVSFIRPLLMFINNPGVDFDSFMVKLRSHWYKIGVRPSATLYVEMFADIYNYFSKKKIDIK